MRRVDELRGTLIPAGVRVDRHARLRRDRQRQGVKSHQEARIRHDVRRGAGVRRARAARGRDRGRRPSSLTLAATLFASWAWGFTLNRVSLFALIFSIGILVDDAIVVVENIHRRRAREAGSLRGVIPGAVDEVGGPTILATLTVIAALLPMAFVSGLMGPYMSPIPINASMGMLISLVIAFTVTPWLALRLMKSHAGEEVSKLDGALERAFARVAAAPGRRAACAAPARQAPGRHRRIARGVGGPRRREAASC